MLTVNVDIETVDMMKMVDDLHLRPHGGVPCFGLPGILMNASRYSVGSRDCELEELDRKLNERQNKLVIMCTSE